MTSRTLGCPRTPTRPGPGPVRGTDQVVVEAVEFLTEFYHRRRRRIGLRARLREVAAEIDRGGTYTHTPDELAFGARLAWRNSVRCIGRARWQSLRVRDCRHVTTIDGIATELGIHLREATGRGKIRSTISVFAPDDPVAGPRARIANDQLVRYAGHAGRDKVVGDPAQLAFTRHAARLGWTPPELPGRFDVLPWVIETNREQPRVVPVPVDAVLEVPISHPDHPWLAGLGLRWHAVPAISNMRLRVGGVDYSCAPFNGWYLGDEIASRNLGDVDRYDQLPAVARGLGLDLHSRTSMWREHAALVLNQAVLASFTAAGVSISDGYTESALFRRFVDGEEAANQPVHADWSWINGFLGHSLAPAFHRYYPADEPATNYWSDASRLAGPSLCDRHAALRARTNGTGAIE